MIALVAGATGLVGSQLLRTLADDHRYHAILALVRRPLPEHLRLARVRAVTVDYDQLQAYAPELAAHHVFCALGTTIRDAGSRDRFRTVDRDYPRALARLARNAGAQHFSLVSAVRADPRSRIFYNRTKGEAEDAVRAVDYPSGAILRPSILGGHRAEPRPMEAIGQRIAALIPGRYRLVDAADVARVMVRLAVEERPGWKVVESEEIRRLAAG